MIAVFNRSPKDADGWANVSRVLWPLVSTELPTDLFEIEGNADVGGRVRLTPKGEIVIPYL